jgi:hypothetical protein
MQTWDLSNMKERHFLDFIAYNDAAVFKIQWLLVEVFGPDVRQGSLHIVFFLGFTDCYTGRFIMFSVFTNTYNKKAKGPTVMEFFTATGKLRTFFLTTKHVRCVHQRWHGTYWYDIQILDTHASTWVHRYSSLEYRIDVCRVTRSVQIEHL